MGDRGINDRIINCEKIKYRQSDFPVSYHYDTVGKAKNAQSGLANWHEEIEILYFTEGEAELYVNLEGHHVKAGDVIFLYPYWLHRTVNLTPLCRYHCLLIHPSFIGFTHEATTDFLISSSDEISESAFRLHTCSVNTCVEGVAASAITVITSLRYLYYASRRRPPPTNKWSVVMLESCIVAVQHSTRLAHSM